MLNFLINFEIEISSLNTFKDQRVDFNFVNIHFMADHYNCSGCSMIQPFQKYVFRALNKDAMKTLVIFYFSPVCVSGYIIQSSFLHHLFLHHSFQLLLCLGNMINMGELLLRIDERSSMRFLCPFLYFKIDVSYLENCCSQSLCSKANVLFPDYCFWLQFKQVLK